MRPEHIIEEQVEKELVQMGSLEWILEALGSHRRFLSILMEVEVSSRAWWSCEWALKSGCLRSDLGSTTSQL